ncbi:MAG: molybdopterin converting factor subunit 1 [Anaerolineaceae bacterium]|nr:molybdopterin converting factor subunit 1 [Anaerolineaceae bacterium]
MQNIRLLFFAALKERAGTARTEIDLPDGTTVAELKTLLASRFPAVAPLLSHSLVSVNQSYAFDQDPIPSDAEVAFFPPVSGGAEETEFPTIFQIANAPLDLDDLVRRITLPTTGAACVFTGMVRGVTQRGDAHETIYLEYEAYVPMAEAKMAQVAQEIRTRWPTVEGIAIVQRIGRLDPGTPTVLIACSASHRDTGVFEAARYGIDRLKEIVPVWKKEFGPGGEEWIEGHYQPNRGD